MKQIINNILNMKPSFRIISNIGNCRLSIVNSVLFLLTVVSVFASCKDDEKYVPGNFKVLGMVDNGFSTGDLSYSGINAGEPVKLKFSEPVDRNTVSSNIELITDEGPLTVNYTYEQNDSVVVLNPVNGLEIIAGYKLNVWHNLYSRSGSKINTGRSYSFTTAIDSTDKFPTIPYEELLTKVQRQTFRYFWDGAHPCGMARERSSSGDIVTTGGTGFGIMAMIVGVERGFITRQQALDRVQRIVSFLTDNCNNYHGAFAHWINGSTGVTIPFSSTDDGADVVETSLLMQGLLTARSYFNGAGAEATLRSGITFLWERVDWKFFAPAGDALYWNWSQNYNWDIGLRVQGWNEALITYVLGASAPDTNHRVSKSMYDNGWAKNGAMRNGKEYYGIKLPLGEDYGGPLFFSHYSFLGLYPQGLKDQYADYWQQNVNHTMINYKYCIDNPKKYVGYSNACWGLTASDGNKSYSAHSPANDVGVIAPTAAISSMPYTPGESKAALEFFYYKLGDYLFKDMGFVDAFNLSARWFDYEYIAIDQGTTIIMIENHRSNLLWHWFMQDADVQRGLSALGFEYKVPELK